MHSGLHETKCTHGVKPCGDVTRFITDRGASLSYRDRTVPCCFHAATDPLLTSGFSRLAQGTDSICLKQACSKLCVHLTKADMLKFDSAPALALPLEKYCDPSAMP